MKVAGVVLALLTAAMMPTAARAQAAAYGELSFSDLHNLNGTDILYGGTAGLLVGGPTVFHHMLLSADLQGRFVGKSGERMDGITIGPRASFPIGHGFAPYGEFLFGFARYAGPQITSGTTDGTIQINGGLTKRMSPHFDLVADYSYAQYYALGGEYNPKTFSVGAVYYFTKR